MADRISSKVAGKIAQNAAQRIRNCELTFREGRIVDGRRVVRLDGQD